MHPKQQQEIDKLQEQSGLLLSGQLLPDVVAVLRAEFSPLPADIFLLNWIPDQFEDFYTFALRTETVCTIKMPRHGGLGVLESVETFRAYRKGPHSRGGNRALDAIELIVRQRKSILDADGLDQ